MGELTVVGVGLDAVDLDRFRQLLDRRRTFADRVFTAEERAVAGRRADPVPALAARFAAKEAVMKALGVGLGAFRFAEVSVGRLDSGAPTLTLRDGAARVAADRGVTGWRVSLTHTDSVAQAVALALGDTA